MTFRQKLFVFFMFLAIASTSALGQFKIKIPGVQKPSRAAQSESKPAEDVDASTSSASGFSGQNREMAMDDGFTFFDAEPVKEYDSAKRLNKDIGWYLESYLRVLGDFPNRSALK